MKKGRKHMNKSMPKDEFELPEPDLEKSNNEYGRRNEETQHFDSKLDKDKRVTNEVLDIEFEV
ncbi:MAG: hypothetical protein WBD28_08710 [Candidatus Zixiibacteriota bacterium]